MNQTIFLSPYKIDLSKLKFIVPRYFLINCALDIFLIILGILIWRYILWVPLNKLRIPIAKNKIGRPYREEYYDISTQSSFFTLMNHIKSLIKNLSSINQNVLIIKCGFEYFTYLYFIRRLCLIMGIIIITDVCVWFPYMLIFLDEGINLANMPSANNNVFRSFYSLWIAFILLYGMHDMRKYLHRKLIYHYYRETKDNDPDEYQKVHMLNNLKAKTIHMELLDGHFSDEASIKVQMQQYLVQDMGQQDRILAIQAIPAFSEVLQSQYRIKIIQIVTGYGLENLSWIWRLFKSRTPQRLLQKKEQQIQKIEQNIQHCYNSKVIKSCLIVVSRIQTAQQLCNKFQLRKALCNVCPQFGSSSQEATWKVADSNMIVRWAQEPKDLIWINMAKHQKELNNFILFNILCVLLLIVSFFFIAITSTHKYIQLPRVLGPVIVLVINALLRFLIAKMVQWETKTLKSDWQIKQFKLTIIYLVINVILGSIVRDTLNLLTLLQRGWGWIQLFSLIFKKADGLFYYLLILNQTATACFFGLVKPGQTFLDCFENGLWYEKLTLKRKSIYGRNDSFALGYAYSLAFLMLSVVTIYSISCPLIHFFGLFYFVVRLYVDTYTISVFHEEQICSNLRFIEKVTRSISTMVAAWIFLIGTTMVFSADYSNAIILYLACGLIIYYGTMRQQYITLQDHIINETIKKVNIGDVVEDWRQEYMHPFNATKNTYLNKSDFNPRISYHQFNKKE